MNNLNKSVFFFTPLWRVVVLGKYYDCQKLYAPFGFIVYYVIGNCEKIIFSQILFLKPQKL
jgi:hypothetical protein